VLAPLLIRPWVIPSSLVIRVPLLVNRESAVNNQKSHERSPLCSSAIAQSSGVHADMALGAQPSDILGLILRQTLVLVSTGMLAGMAAALGGTRLLVSVLYGVGATDLLTYGGVLLLLGGAAFLASYLPARRATKVDPMVALRYE